MDEDRQLELDQQVQAVMRELQGAGESVNVEGVARTIRRRTSDVLDSIKRLTRGTPAVDHETLPEQYPGVLAAERKVAAIEASRQDAERTLQDREIALAQAEAVAAEALIDGREPLSLVEARQAVLAAAETLRLLELAHGTAKRRHSAALAAAEVAHQRAVWQRFQQLLQAHLVAVRQTVESWEPLRAYCAAHDWRFGLQPFQGSMQILQASWLPYAEGLLSQEAPAHGGGNLPPMLQPHAY